MAQRSSNPFQLLQLSTDFPALFAIVIGLGIAIFIDNTALRLIGVCVSVLGSVGLFVMISQRTRDVPPEGLRTIRIQEQPHFRTIVKDDSGAKRLVFDDFTESVIADDPLASKIVFPTHDSSPHTESTTTTSPTVISPAVSPASTTTSTMPKKIVFSDFSDDVVEIHAQPTVQPEPVVQSEPVVQTESSSTSYSSDTTTTSSISDETRVDHHAVLPHEVSQYEDIPTESESLSLHDASSIHDHADHTLLTPAETVPVADKDSDASVHESVSSSADELLSAPVSKTVGESRSESTGESRSESTGESRSESSSDAHSELSSTYKRLMLRVQTQDFSEESVPTDRDEPRLEFDFLLQRVLRVIRSVVPARTVLFTWLNTERAELIIEEKISDIPELIIPSNMIPIGNDVLSQIGVIAKPEILTEINPSAELDLLPYYTSSAGTRSFVGIPVIYDGVVVAILTADTNEDDAYDQSTVMFLGHFTRLLSGLIHSYNDKYDLMQSARIVTALDRFRTMLDQHASREELCSAALDALHERLPHCFSLSAICANNQGIWHIAHIHSAHTQQQALRGVHVDLESSMVGKTIYHSHLQEMVSVGQDEMRLAPHEMTHAQSYFTAVPIISSTYCYGAFVVEEADTTVLTRQDIRLVEAIADAVGMLLEQQTLRSLLTSNALRDATTGLLNRSAFVERAEEEVLRAKHFTQTVTVAMIALDEYSALSIDADPALEAVVLRHVIGIIRKHIRTFDIIARFDKKMIVLLFVQKTLQEAHILAERIRKDTAMSFMQYNGRQLTATLSIGVAELVQQHTAAELLDNAQTALSVAKLKTNAVSMFA